LFCVRTKSCLGLLALRQHYICLLKRLPMKGVQIVLNKPTKGWSEHTNLCCCRLIICQQWQLCTCALPHRDVSALVGHVVPLHADCHHVQVSILPKVSNSTFLLAYFCVH